MAATAVGSPRLTVSPAVIDFEKVGDWEEGRRTISIRCGGPVALAPLSASLSDNRIELVELPGRSPDTLGYQIIVPRDYPPGDFSGNGLVETNQGTIRFTCQGEKVGPVFAVSSVAVFRPQIADAAHELSSTVLLRHAPDGEVNKASAHSVSGTICVRQIIQVSAGMTRVVLALSPSSSEVPLRGRMNIFTNQNGSEDPVALEWFVAGRINRLPTTGSDWATHANAAIESTE